MKRLDSYWHSRNIIAGLLLPISWLFSVAVWLRRWSYERNLLLRQQIPVPVIIAGNITVGGTGKTPLVIWLARYLEQAGYQPGIISRGYGGKAVSWPQRVGPESDPTMVGDEPVLLARRTGCPMWVGSDRPAAARALLDASNCDIIISDDGLQHYALGRDIEIAVIDGQRQLGNGFCLPAGPLREPSSRLKEVDLVVVNGTSEIAGYYGMTLEAGNLINLLVPKEQIKLEAFDHTQVHGIAAIGNPDRFFDTLSRHGLKVIKHPFDDHHFYSPEEISPDDDLPVLMTEKDAVKCFSFAQKRHWYLQVNASIDAGFSEHLGKLLRDLKHG